MERIYVTTDPSVMLSVPNIWNFGAKSSSRTDFTPINDNQIKGFIRDKIVEELLYPCSVFSINNCYDKLRDKSSQSRSYRKLL